MVAIGTQNLKTFFPNYKNKSTSSNVANIGETRRRPVYIPLTVFKKLQHGKETVYVFDFFND